MISLKNKNKMGGEEKKRGIKTWKQKNDEVEPHLLHLGQAFYHPSTLSHNLILTWILYPGIFGE